MLFLCLKPLAADSMRPNKLRRHLETTHPSHINKPLDFFQRKLAEYRQQETRMVKAASVNSKAQMASYRVAYRLHNPKTTHNRRAAHSPRCARHGVQLCLTRQAQQN